MIKAKYKDIYKLCCKDCDIIQIYKSDKRNRDIRINHNSAQNISLRYNVKMEDR